MPSSFQSGSIHLHTTSSLFNESRVCGCVCVPKSEHITPPFKIIMTSHCSSNSSPWCIGPHMAWPRLPHSPHFLPFFLYSWGVMHTGPFLHTHTMILQSIRVFVLAIFLPRMFFPLNMCIGATISKLLAPTHSLLFTLFHFLITLMCCLITYFSSFSSL